MIIRSPWFGQLYNWLILHISLSLTCHHPSRQFLACDVVSTWIWGWNHVATSLNFNTTSHRRRISDVVLTRKNDIIRPYNVVSTSCLKRCWNQVEIALQLRWNHVEIMTLKQISFENFFNVVSTPVCYFSTSFQRWNNVVVPAGISWLTPE